MPTPLQEGLRLELPGTDSATTSLADVNDALASYGAHLWPLGLGDLADDLRALVRQPTLTESESARLMEAFLLSRERILEIVAAAGREPEVPGGGEMSTFVANYNYSYPQLFLIEEGIDYSRFDRFHVNTSDDGTGADEVMQILTGSGVRYLQRLSGGDIMTLHLDCPSEDAGWIITYDGGRPHIGSISGAEVGTKVLMQVIGPAQWVMRYDEDG